MHKSPRAHKPYMCAKSRTTYAKPLTGHKIRTTYVRRLLQPSITNQQKKKEKKILSVMARGEQVKSTRVYRDWIKAIKVTSSIRLEYSLEKEVQPSLEDGAIRELSVLTDMENDDSTCIK